MIFRHADIFFSCFFNDENHCVHQSRERRYIVDSGYRGQIHAIISNVSNKPKLLSKDSRIGQLIIMPVVIADFVNELRNGRGSGAFGSTGE